LHNVLGQNKLNILVGINMTKLKIGVAGAGVFGNNHSNKIMGDNRAQLIGIFDHDLARAQELAQKFNAKGYDNLDELLNDVDALVIAIPAIAHAQVATTALLAGKHCLVEKPLAANAKDAAMLCEIAEKNNLVLQAGHQERYIFKAMGLLDVKDAPISIEASRIGLPNVRGSDVSATLDLMVHDIDLASLLFKSNAKEINATLLAGDKAKADALEANIIYENGAKAKFIASRAADVRDRKTKITYENGIVEIDYIARTFVDTTPYNLHQDFAERIKDPMQAAMSDFISAILGEIPVSIPARDGEKAVIIAQEIDNSL
jgi:predicted dehydrogenase